MSYAQTTDLLQGV